MIQILWILFIIKQAKFLSFGHDSSVPVVAVITARKEVYHNEVMPILMNLFGGWQSIMIS